jgi:uncharacterized membrane protein (UPF0127 family)
VTRRSTKLSLSFMAAPLLALALAASAGAQPAEPTAAQPKLPTAKLEIIGRNNVKHDFTVELALTEQQQQTGEMFRTSVPADQGMLFDWHTPRDVPMWMKNTLVPLDMIFIGNDGTITHIEENAVPQSLAVIPSGGPVRATLEVQGGLTEKLDIRVGDKVKGAIF